MSSSLPEDDQTESERLQAALETVTQKFLELGMIPLQKFADTPAADLEGFDIPFLAPESSRIQTSSIKPRSTPVTIDSQPLSVYYKKNPSALTMQYVAQLHKTCEDTFGNSDGLRFEFLEEDGPNSESHRSYVDIL